MSKTEIKLVFVMVVLTVAVLIGIMSILDHIRTYKRLEREYDLQTMNVRNRNILFTYSINNLLLGNQTIRQLLETPTETIRVTSKANKRIEYGAYVEQEGTILKVRFQVYLKGQLVFNKDAWTVPLSLSQTRRIYDTMIKDHRVKKNANKR